MRTTYNDIAQWGRKYTPEDPPDRDKLLTMLHEAMGTDDLAVSSCAGHAYAYAGMSREDFMKKAASKAADKILPLLTRPESPDGVAVGIAARNAAEEVSDTKHGSGWSNKQDQEPPRWINVYDFHDVAFGGKPQYQGRFNLDTATEYDGAEDRNDNTATMHALYRTKSGRWVRNSWTNWAGSIPKFWFVSDTEAREWLIENGHEKAVAEHFGTVGEEGPPVRGRGRPPIGGRVETSLGDLVPKVDRWARDNGVLHDDGRPNRSEAVRRLVGIALGDDQ